MILPFPKSDHSEQARLLLGDENHGARETLEVPNRVANGLWEASLKLFRGVRHGDKFQAMADGP